MEEKKWKSAGCICFKHDPQTEELYVCIVAPSNQYGGYSWVFPKGKIDPGETPKQAAIRETFEEAGIGGNIIGYVGEYQGNYSLTKYFAMEVTSEDAATDFETAEVKFVTTEEASALLAPRDQKALGDFTKKLLNYK